MKRKLGSRLFALRGTGEIKTGRQIAEEQKKETRKDLFPGEGRQENTAYGPCYYRETIFPLDYMHGGNKLSGFLACSGPELTLLTRDKTLCNLNPAESVFLDIETTGLAGGTGTWTFLIGLGRVLDQHFVLRQYFLRRPSEEKAMLSHFNAFLSGYQTMITFNGKQFDLPLIKTRQMLAGLKLIELEQHLDLLQCARTLWRKRLASRSLRSIEEALLNIKRHDDIPGSEIPEVYFNYLRRGETILLKKVFHHNTLDILSMATMLERFYHTITGRLAKHPAESLALGSLCLESGRGAEGVEYLREACEHESDPLAQEAALKLSLHFKRQGRWEEALKIWEETIEKNPCNIPVLIELAKYYEHRAGQFQTALDLTEKALILARIKGTGFYSASSAFSIKSLMHRKIRLYRRLGS